MGMNSATADYACLWCKVQKDNRWDTTKLSNYYNQQPLQRTLEGKSRSSVNARKTIMGALMSLS